MFTFNKQKMKCLLMMTLFLGCHSSAAEKQASFARRWYVGGLIGTHLKANGNTQIPSIAFKPPLTSEPVYQAGSALQLAIGRQISPHVRLESMLSYQNLPMQKINNAIGEGTVTIVDHSYTRLFSLFINGYYDFNPAWIVHPYVGLGGGYVKIKNIIRPAAPIPVAPGLFFTEKEVNYDTLGFQGILGITYPLTRNSQMDFNYQYFSTLKKSVRGYTNLGQDSYQTKQKITDNLISLGFRYYFF